MTRQSEGTKLRRGKTTVLGKNQVKARNAEIKGKTTGNEREHVKIHCRMKGMKGDRFWVKGEIEGDGCYATGMLHLPPLGIDSLWRV